MIPVHEWKWHGHKQHLCVGWWCQFSMATEVGDVIVSTIGEYKRPGNEDEEGWSQIGMNRCYETMVFRTSTGRHECGCPEFGDPGELEMTGYNSAAAATAGHMATCHKWAAKGAK